MYVYQNILNLNYMCVVYFPELYTKLKQRLIPVAAKLVVYPQNTNILNIIR
jgi:hypothetical protein